MLEKYEQLSFPASIATATQFEPVSHVASGARDYAKQRGQDYSTEGLDQTQMDPRRGHAIAKEYERNEQHAPSERTKASYEALRTETRQQFEHLTKPEHEGGMGFSMEVTDEDPYPSSQAMAEDVRNKKIKVLSTETTGGHAIMSNEENDQFRAVHDVFGHAGTGRGFSRHGEEAAWRSHVQMYSPAAREAVTSETRGQNSYLNNLNKGFPDNAMVDMPDWAQDPGKFRGVSRTAKIKPKPQGEQLSFDV